MQQALLVQLKSLPPPFSNHWCLSPGSLPRRQLIVFLLSGQFSFTQAVSQDSKGSVDCCPILSFSSFHLFKRKILFLKLTCVELAPAFTAELLEKDGQ